MFCVKWLPNFTFSKGEVVDSACMNSLLLGGIINILIQHDAIEDLNGKIRTLEEENVGNRARIESLESWASKQAEEFKDITKKMIENEEIEALNHKVTDLELEVSDLKSHTNSVTVPNSSTEEMIHRRPCHLCNKPFTKNSDLEIHLMEIHGVEKKFSCEVCEKEFVLEWRFKKHITMHTATGIKPCRFYNNKTKCPYEDIGCMFLHKFKQGDIIDTVTDESEVEEIELIREVDPVSEQDLSDAVQEHPLNNNKCHLCSKQLNSKDDLYIHVESEHEEFFNGIMEAAAMMPNLN